MQTKLNIDDLIVVCFVMFGISVVNVVGPCIQSLCAGWTDYINDVDLLRKAEFWLIEHSGLTLNVQGFLA